MARRAWLNGGIGLVVLFGATAAWAQQGFALDRFNPAEAGSEWFALDNLDLRSVAWPAVSVQGEVAHLPLATHGVGGALRAAVVENQAFVRFAASMVLFDHLRLSANLPLSVYQNGASDPSGAVRAAPATSTATLADARVGADVRITGTAGKPFTLVGGAQFFIPSGSRSQYTGDGSIRILPRLMAAGDLGSFAYAAQVGFQYRALSERVGTATIGNEVLFGCAFGIRLAGKKLLVGPELYGSTVIPKSVGPLAVVDTPIEALMGVHYKLPAGLMLAAGGGVGLSQGIGSPQARFVFSFGWKPDALSDADAEEPADPADNLPNQPDANAEEAKADSDYNFALPDSSGEAPGPKQQTKPTKQKRQSKQKNQTDQTEQEGEAEQAGETAQAEEPVQSEETEQAEAGPPKRVTRAQAAHLARSSENMSGPEDTSTSSGRRGFASKARATSVALADHRVAGKQSAGRSRMQQPKTDHDEPADDLQREDDEVHTSAMSLEGSRANAEPTRERQAGSRRAALTSAIIAKTIGKNRRVFQPCIDAELRRNPDFQGREVLINASLRPSGSVGDVSIEDPEIELSLVGSCLKQKARRIVFPAFRGDPMAIEIPLVLISGT